MEQRDTKYWLHRSEQLRLAPFVYAVDDISVPFTLSDPNEPDNPLVYVNQAFCDLTGYSEEELLGRNCRFLQGEETDDERVAEIADAIKAYEPCTVEVMNYRKDGTPFRNELHVSPVWSPDGDLLYFAGSQIDTTNRAGTEDFQIDAMRFQARAVHLMAREAVERLRNMMDLSQGMIRLHIEALPDGEAREALRSAYGRVEAMIAVEDRTGSMSGDVEVPLDGVLSDLANSLETITRHRVKVDAAGTEAPRRILLPLALIISDLVLSAQDTSLDDGDSTHRGTIRVAADCDGETLTLTVEDDGVGFGTEATPGATRSFRSQMISHQASQIGAHVDIDHSASGGRMVMSIPMDMSSDEDEEELQSA